MNFKAILVVCGLLLLAVIGPAAITRTSTNNVGVTRWDALVPALQAQVQALTIDVSNLLVKANATTNATVIYCGPSTNLLTNSFAVTVN